jgi:hypothetical protein
MAHPELDELAPLVPDSLLLVPDSLPLVLAGSAVGSVLVLPVLAPELLGSLDEVPLLGSVLLAEPLSLVAGVDAPDPDEDAASAGSDVPADAALDVPDDAGSPVGEVGADPEESGAVVPFPVGGICTGPPVPLASLAAGVSGGSSSGPGLSVPGFVCVTVFGAVSAGVSPP